MMKRKRELEPVLAVLPPCKKPLCSDIVQATPGRKRKLEEEEKEKKKSPCAECDRMLPPLRTSASPPLCKKLRETPSPHYKCQKDEAFPEYNSFQYWKTPLPDIDFSELSEEPCGVAINNIQEMDS